MQSSGTAATHHHTQLCYTVAVSSQSRTVHLARKEEDWFLKPQDSFQKIHSSLQTPPWAGQHGCCLGRSRRCTLVGGACWEGVSFPNTCVGLDCICLPVRSHIKCFLCLFHLLVWVWMTCVWWSEEWILFFYHVRPGDQIQTISLGGRCLYLLNYLARHPPIKCFKKKIKSFPFENVSSKLRSHCPWNPDPDITTPLERIFWPLYHWSCTWSRAWGHTSVIPAPRR